jgi:sporulation protein YlmC with PRC-barrel domain
MNIRILTLAALASAALVTPVFAQSAAQAAYDAQMREYQRQQEDYRQARDAYNADLNRYNNDEYYYERDDGPYTRASYAPFNSLAQIGDKALIGKPVETIDGDYVGYVTNHRIIGNKTTELQVKINPARVTWVLSGDLRYDEAADVVVTDLTADQMAGRSRIDY